MYTIVEIIEKLNKFWIEKGCIPIYPWSKYVGAATFHPTCFFSSLDKNPSSYCYVQKSTRKADARFGESPNRLLSHHQFQVIFTPEIYDTKVLFLEFLEYIGLNSENNSIQFIDNNWENISLGAIGVGWECLCNNMEICQFTYFQKMADLEPSNNTVELAFGIERLACALNKKNINEIVWAGEKTYGNLRFQEEYEFSHYFSKFNNVNSEDFFSKEKDIYVLLDNNLCYPAYDLLLDMIDVFNSLDALKLVSQVQRKEYITLTRKIAKKIAEKYIESKVNLR